jgi:hypothetical protein
MSASLCVGMVCVSGSYCCVTNIPKLRSFFMSLCLGWLVLLVWARLSDLSRFSSCICVKLGSWLGVACVVWLHSWIWLSGDRMTGPCVSRSEARAHNPWRARLGTATFCRKELQNHQQGHRGCRIAECFLWFHHSPFLPYHKPVFSQQITNCVPRTVLGLRR